MLTESLFDASGAAAPAAGGQALRSGCAGDPGMGLSTRSRRGYAGYAAGRPPGGLHGARRGSSSLFLCFLPMGKHFHVITSLFNVFFMRLDKGTVKPVRYGIGDSGLDELESLGVKRFEDFTWKHILDFLHLRRLRALLGPLPCKSRGSSTLSSIHHRSKDGSHAFSHYPLHGKNVDGGPLIGSVYDEQEVWSCTTCGACEEECPLGIEYIDKIVDLRRAMVDDGMVPQSLQKPLSALEKRGNPWGKMERKRAEWTTGLPAGYNVKLADRGEPIETLYFVDSVSSYDDRMQYIARATARILCAARVDFGILGKDERDSGHEVRRFGEEMLFQSLKEQNTEAILASGATRIVTADPHAYNALKKDYSGLPRVEHISEVILDSLRSGAVKLRPVEDGSKTYVYHDPCYLGRHNGLYDPPRRVIRDIPGIRLVEMEGDCRDRSFCCGGGGLMLFYEPEEQQRMGVLRVQVARKAACERHRYGLSFLPRKHRRRNKGSRSGRQDRGNRSLRTDRPSHRTAIPQFADCHRQFRRMNMEILVCVKRIPDSAENEIEISRDGSDIKRDNLVYSVNEWDNYAVEEAIQIAARVGGSVTVVSIGDEDTEEVVRREMAMGANQGLLLIDEAFEGSDGRGIASILKAAVQKGKYDLVLTGAQADDQAAQVGGMLAAMLDWPYASLVISIEICDGRSLSSCPGNRGRQPGN